MKLAQMENATRQLTDAQFGSLIRACLGFRLRGEGYTGGDPQVKLAFRFLTAAEPGCCGGECLLREGVDAWAKRLNGEQEGF